MTTWKQSNSDLLTYPPAAISQRALWLVIISAICLSNFQTLD